MRENKKKKISDRKWERIEAEYREGRIALREVSRKHGVPESTIRNRAKAAGWKRDLAPEIRARVKGNLVKAMVEEAGANEPLVGKIKEPLEDEEIVELAAARATAVVQDHIKMLSSMRVVGNALMNQLLHRRPDIQLAADGSEIEVPRTLRDDANILKGISDAMCKVITLERQTYNLDDPDFHKKQQAVQFVLNLGG